MVIFHSYVSLPEGKIHGFPGFTNPWFHRFLKTAARRCSSEMLRRNMPCPLCRVASTSVLRGCSLGLLAQWAFPSANPRTYWCVLRWEWMGCWGNGMIITSDYGLFPHSPLSTSKMINLISLSEII